jgi:hypothetical protein
VIFEKCFPADTFCEAGKIFDLTQVSNGILENFQEQAFHLFSFQVLIDFENLWLRFRWILGSYSL